MLFMLEGAVIIAVFEAETVEDVLGARACWAVLGCLEAVAAFSLLPEERDRMLNVDEREGDRACAGFCGSAEMVVTTPCGVSPCTDVGAMFGITCGIGGCCGRAPCSRRDGVKSNIVARVLLNEPFRE